MLKKHNLVKKGILRGIKMKNDKIITINGRSVDSSTGKPVARPKKSLLRGDIIRLNHSKSLHVAPKRPQELHTRSVIKRPAIRAKSLARKPGHNMDIARSSNITRFTKQPIVASTPSEAKKSKITDTKPPVRHPMAEKAHKMHAEAKKQAEKPKIAKSAKTIKNEAIAEALSKPSIKPEKISVFKRHPKLFNVFTISLVIIFIAGYLTYLNMPSLSVMVASAQAGIDATYPEYRPDGYSLSGPITYSDGQVTINFHGNTGNSKFVIEQSKSSWDSSAVKDKINKDSKGQFVTTEEHGLTIYTYDGNAAWVNGGILYNISGDAPLSGDQIRRIATSL